MGWVCIHSVKLQRPRSSDLSDQPSSPHPHPCPPLAETLCPQLTSLFPAVQAALLVCLRVCIVAVSARGNDITACSSSETRWAPNFSQICSASLELQVRRRKTKTNNGSTFSGDFFFSRLCENVCWERRHCERLWVSRWGSGVLLQPFDER